MSTLERKLTRDLWRLKGQVATIALVLACGIMAMIMLRSTWVSLLGARDAYYDEYRFADVFAHLQRAPDAVARRLEQVPGVAVVYPRLVREVMVPLADEPDPTRLHHLPLDLVVVTIAIGLASAVLGAVVAVRRIAKLPPAEAMRPPAPPSYRRGVIERLRLDRAFGQSGMMAVREIQRRPFRFALSVLGIAMGIAIFVMGRFSWDSFERLMDDQFPRENRQDLTVTLVNPLPERALREMPS